MARVRNYGCAIPSLVALTAIVLVGSAATLGREMFTAAALAAALPLPLYLAAALWIDRFEPEPRGLLVLAFLWGTSVAILVSGVLNGIADSTIGEAASTMVGAPVSEEVLKSVVLIYLFARRRDEFDGVVDGVVYAALVGLGFAFVENIDYYGRALQTEGTQGLAVTVTLRGVISPYSHPLFTGMTGIGLGLARQTSRGWVRWAAPVAGLAAAILLHALWNAGAQAGCVFFVVYAFIMLPAFGALLGVVAWSLHREGHLLREHLQAEFELGLLPATSYAEVCSVRQRLLGSTRALVRGGPRAWRRARRVHHAAAELAFLRYRVARGLQRPDPDLEQEYLRALVPADARVGPVQDVTVEVRPGAAFPDLPGDASRTAAADDAPPPVP
ncbi:MAG: PrsW family intramembrane metalloprotease [Acidobacteriota bacterium]